MCVYKRVKTLFIQGFRFTFCFGVKIGSSFIYLKLLMENDI